MEIMTVQTKHKVSWSFWLQWVFANAIAFTVASILANDISNAMFHFLSVTRVMFVSYEVPSTAVFGGMVFGAIHGLLIGAVQSLVLHRYFHRAGRWSVATGLGESLAAGINNFGAITSVSAFPIFVPGIVSGIFVGTFQWIVLKQRFLNSGWWILASVIGLGTVTVVSSWLGPRLTESIAGFLNGIIFGSITGLVLVQLLNHPKQQLAESIGPAT